ncbi:unnamed protein product [Amaranthus hypochondriacus]
MDDSMSSTNHKIRQTLYSDNDFESSSEDSSWSLYLDNSVATSHSKGSVTCSDSEISSIYSGPAGRAKKMNQNEDHIETARSSAKRRKMTVTCIDHELEDTATSPVCNSVVQELEQWYLAMQEIISSDLNVFPSVEQDKLNYAWVSQVLGNDARTIINKAQMRPMHGTSSSGKRKAESEHQHLLRQVDRVLGQVYHLLRRACLLTQLLIDFNLLDFYSSIP